MKNSSRILSLLFFAGLQLMLAQQSMVVSVTGIRANAGIMKILLFTNADAFPTKPDNAFRSTEAAVTSSTMTVKFENVPSGTYGIAVYHDENANGKMDRHWYGPPKEGSGSSNDAKGSFGPPSFEDARFNFNNSQDTIKISIHY